MLMSYQPKSRKLITQLQHLVTHYNKLQHTATQVCWWAIGQSPAHSFPSCNSLQQLATHCDTMQHRYADELPIRVAHTHHLQLPATSCNTLQHTATHCNTDMLMSYQPESRTLITQLQHLVTHYNTLQHTATQVCWWATSQSRAHSSPSCNSLQHLATL